MKTSVTAAGNPIEIRTR